MKQWQLIYCGVVAALLMLTGLSQDVRAQDAESAVPYFFVVGADPQLYMKQTDDRNWRRTVGLVNRLNPDFFIVCGDLTHAPNEAAAWDRPKGVTKYDKLAADYNKVASELTVPLRNVAGNHDVSLEPTPKTIAWYEGHFGKAWYAFEHRKSLFVVLESNLLRMPDGAPDLANRQLDWLRGQVDKAKTGAYVHKMAFMHHPLCLKSVDEKSGYFNMPVERRGELLKLFHGAGFAAVFCGHYHRNAYVRDGDLEIITTSSCGAALGKDPLGFRIVTVYPDRIEHKYYGFDDVPETVDMAPAPDSE